ncbi:Set1 complex component [Lachnellula subtilissima]|uniref:Set1 complex component n=1 Tax=Lachnellula subtilissima TaxID=602034 RepID=A0A8H8S3A5_9HELO|nr:Set1 complex component [Lachnellula subtilissima]
MSQPNTPSESVQDPSSSINAAAQAYQQQQQQAPTPSAAMPDSIRDVVMSDSTPDRPASPAIATGATNVPSPVPVPARIGTPSRNTNGDATSRATSQHPDPAPAIPKEAPPHGAPTRQYLNGKVTGVLLDGMKQLAKEQPKDPLRVLGEYLLQRSRELEGT